MRTAKRIQRCMPPHCVTQFIVKAGSVIVIKFMTAWCVYSLEFYNHQFNPLARRENGKVRECGKGEKEKEFFSFFPQVFNPMCNSF